MIVVNRRTAVTAMAAGAVTLAAGRAGAQAAPISARILLEDERLWLAASVNGSEPLLFVLDTGASGNFIRPDLAARLKLTGLGGGQVRGLGKSAADTAIVRARTVVFGGTSRQDGMTFSTYDFGRGALAEAAGLFAAGLVTAHDSDLDFDRSQWTVWRSGRPDRDGFTVLPSVITRPQRARGSEKIYVTAQIDGGSYRLLVDTGAPRGVLLFPVAAGRSRLFGGRPFAPAMIAGFGGRAARPGRTVRAGRLELGPLVVDRPLVTLMDPGQPMQAWDADGILGLTNITLLNLSTDVRANRLWVQRNRQPAKPDRYVRTGLLVDRDAAGRAVVAVVGTGSPAASAGLMVGDRIMDPPSFAGVIALLAAAPGRPVTMAVDRGGARMEKTLSVADYL